MEGENKWFCDGIILDISDNLSRLNYVRTISNKSTEKYRVTDKAIPEIAEDLGANYFLEGGIRIFNDHLIVNIQLVDAKGITLWSETISDEMDQVFKIQQNVAKRIVELLDVTVSPEERSLLTFIPTKDIEAYKLLLKGRNVSSSAFYGNRNYEEAIALFEESILIDPDYAAAYAELAYAQLYRFLVSDRYDSVYLQQCKVNIKNALTLDPLSVQAYVTRAVIYDAVEDDDDKAAEWLDKAYSINPDNSMVNFEYAWYYKELIPPDNKKYLHYISNAAELDPLSNDNQLFKLDALLLNEKIKEAEAYHSKLVPSLNKMQELYRMAEIRAHKYKDRSEMLNVYFEALKKDSLNPEIYQRIAEIYNVFLNNDPMAVKYYTKAYELDPTYIYNYIFILCENKEFDKAISLAFYIYRKFNLINF
jgi:TolB-like protein/Tfp pilus assembly protein PilF